MNEPDAQDWPTWNRRMRELRLEAEQIASSTDIGEPHVRRLQEILAEQEQILDASGATAQEQHRAAARRLHRGRAVDIPPRSPLADWIRQHPPRHEERPRTRK